MVAEKLLSSENPLKFLTNAGQDLGDLTNFELGTKSWHNQYSITKSVMPSWIPRWKKPTFSMLGPWSLEDSFNPASGYEFKRLTAPNPLHLATGGFTVSTTLFCSQIIFSKRLIDETLVSLLASSTFGPLSLGMLELLSYTLSAGRDACGSRERQKKALLPHFAA